MEVEAEEDEVEEQLLDSVDATNWPNEVDLRTHLRYNGRVRGEKKRNACESENVPLCDQLGFT